MTVLCALLGHEARPNEFLAKIFGMKGLPATLPRPLEWEAVSNLDWPWLVCTSRIHFGLNLRGEGVADRSTLQARGTSSADELNVGLIAGRPKTSGMTGAPQTNVKSVPLRNWWWTQLTQITVQPDLGNDTSSKSPAQTSPSRPNWMLAAQERSLQVQQRNRQSSQS